MIITTRALSLILFLATNAIAYRSNQPVRWIALVCAGFWLGPEFFGFHLPVVTWFAGLILIALVLWWPSPRRPAWFLAFSVVALGVTLTGTWLDLNRASREDDRLRALYPFESMEDRLPAPPATAAQVRLTRNGEGWLARREAAGKYPSIRSRRLDRLHERSVELFTRRVGFGITRTLDPSPTETNLAWDGSGSKKLAQPGPYLAATGSPSGWVDLIGSEQDRLGQFHEESVDDFGSNWGFGYFKDRRHVAGFQPHRLHKIPESDPRWRLRTCELLGFLAEEPRVYVADLLPRMADLKSHPTRPLDPFEAVGLACLQGGDDVMIVREGATTPMLGAIRAAQQCVACHQAERGQLLGAFSYTLRDAD